MIKADKYFKKNLLAIDTNGCWDENPRPKWSDGTSAFSKFITQVFEEYDLTKNEFPIPTIRNTAIKMGINEILWIYQDQSNKLEDAHKRGITWWDSWDVGDGTIGNRYGGTVVYYSLMDNLLNGLKNDPFGRRHIIDLFQYEELYSTKGLYPCAFMTQWSVREKYGVKFLDCTLNIRSNDFIVAGYINRIQYVALQMMIASHCGYEVGKFCCLVQNLHVYDRHFTALHDVLNTKPLDIQPKISLKERKSFYDFTIDDFIITGTENIPKLPYALEVAV